MNLSRFALLLVVFIDVMGFGLILGFFFEPNFKRRKIEFGMGDVFTNLWRVKDNPAILRLSLVLRHCARSDGGPIPEPVDPASRRS